MGKSRRTKKARVVWSATPTPFTDKMNIDSVSVRRLVAHHLRLGVEGLFLAGTCGEGPWMTEQQRRKMVQTTTKYAKGKLKLAVQVTDNSAARILDNMRMAKKDGADIAVIAPPFFLLNATPERILDVYVEAIRKSPLPVGIYDRGKFGTVFVPNGVLGKLYSEKNVVMVKDSSSDPKRMKIALAAREKRPRLKLLNGNEFEAATYMKAGYDGLLLGGGIFNGYMAGKIIEAVRAGDIELAEQRQQDMNRFMFAVYGGKKIKCWLSGQKKLLVEMGIFRTWKSYLNFPLTETCDKAIKRVLKKNKDLLFP